ncbi:MAG TPA: hypothetical protein VKP58_00645 [Candidatus Acidoferrum sp.]|nr:hypothetical protein [Candidatus Acidoferrum sp.]
MKARIAAVTISFFVLAIAVLAHGDKKHVMGIVQSVSTEAVTVKLGDGKIVTVKLTATTIYILKDGKSADGTPAKFSDLTAGQRVIIHATPKGNDLLADEVKFAPLTGATPH